MKKALTRTLLGAAATACLLVALPISGQDKSNPGATARASLDKGPAVLVQQPMSLEEVQRRSCDAPPNQAGPSCQTPAPTSFSGDLPGKPAFGSGGFASDKEGPLQKIQNGPCAFCNSNSNCSTECIDDNGNQSDCGDYGVCDPCREALVEIGRVQIGRKAKEVFWGFCEFKWYYTVSYRSVNSPSCQVYTQCEVDTETHTFWPENLYCCDQIPGGCFGVRC